jgi:hypothetical protein
MIIVIHGQILITAKALKIYCTYKKRKESLSFCFTDIFFREDWWRR